MRIIAHRGNINGPDVNKENSPTTIYNALTRGFDVEIDVQERESFNRRLLVGHDDADYVLNLDEIDDVTDRVWFHAKNTKAAMDLLDLKREFGYNYHIFMHNKDQAVLTDTGFIWEYPTVYFTTGPTMINVMPESVGLTTDDFKPWQFHAICTDYARDYAKVFK